MVGEFLLGVLIALLLTTPITIGVPLFQYWLWLRRFRRDNRIAKQRWEAECRADELRWETETRELLSKWEHPVANGN